jgi:hydroxymethylbilane synthase
MEGKGFFTKEIEDALLSKNVDLAVHSHKDLETTPPEGLVIAGVPIRANVEDILLINKESVSTERTFGLKENAVVGTSSVRRKVQLAFHCPETEVKDLRGNVPTRIQKLREKQYDAILLARAGVDRLEIDLSEFHVEILPAQQFVPAPAQGALALQCREGDEEIISILNHLNHASTVECVFIEREILRRMNGGCQLPLGAFAVKEGNTFVCHLAFAKTVNDEVSYFSMRNEEPQQIITHLLGLIQSV